MKSQSLISAVMLVVAIGVFGCSKNEPVGSGSDQPAVVPAKTVAFSGMKFAVLSGDVEVTAEGFLKGAATLIAVTPLQTDKVILTATTHLTDEDESEIRFLSYADKSLNGGVETLFTTHPSFLDRSYALKFYARFGANMKPVDLKGAGLEDGKASLGVEVHADHGHGHVLVNSKEVAGFGFPSVKTPAKFWGIKISKALVESIQIEAGKED